MIKTHHILAGLLIGCCSCLHAQRSESPYKLDLRTDLPLLAGGIGFGAYAIHLSNNVSPLSTSEIERLNRSEIFSIDRHAADGYDRSLVEASDWLLYGSYALPLTLLANRQTRKDFGTISVMMAEVLLVTNDITSITKSTTQRVRPFVYNSEAPLEDKTTKNAKLSFISGHTSNVAAMSFFTAKVISDYSDNRALKRVTWSLAIALPATVGFMRYQSGKHFATDVLAGYAVGALVGYLVPALHKRKSNRLDISLAPGIGQTPSQLGMRWRF